MIKLQKTMDSESYHDVTTIINLKGTSVCEQPVLTRAKIAIPCTECTVTLMCTYRISIKPDIHVIYFYHMTITTLIYI